MQQLFGRPAQQSLSISPLADQVPALSRPALKALLRLLEEETGIQYGENKRPLIISRLTKRVRERGVVDFDAYVALLRDPLEAKERAHVVDVLTTHETYFFREASHFQWLAERAKAHARAGKGVFRLLSAASSSGEEAYSAAMVLASNTRMTEIEIVGVDVSPAVVEKASQGLYPLARAETIPRPHLVQWCRKGTGQFAGTFMIARDLRSRVRFRVANLMEPLSGLGSFDVVFLRNVLIYFDDNGRRAIVNNVLPTLKTGGHLVVGHSESITGVHPALRPVAASTYHWEPR